MDSFWRKKNGVFSDNGCETALWETTPGGAVRAGSFRYAHISPTRDTMGSLANTIDSFLDNEEPCASFHDAGLISLNIDYERRELISEWQLCVGDPDAPEPADRERTRRGRLRFSGVFFWIVEPHQGLLDGTPPWLTNDGPLLDAGTPLAETLSKRVPPGAVAWYLYFSDWNAFAYCAAESGAFEWVD